MSGMDTKNDSQALSKPTNKDRVRVCRQTNDDSDSDTRNGSLSTLPLTVIVYK